MDFRHLEAFTQVIRLGSFSRAAETLYLTQPTVSAHIAALERELGIQLVQRTPRGAVATEGGRVMYEYALDLLSLRDRALEAIRREKEELRGTVHIAASTVTFQYFLPKVMSSFRHLHPEVTFHIKTCDSAQVVSSILSGDSELGMTGAAIPGTKCRYSRFMTDELVVITPNSPPYQGIDPDCFPLEKLVAAPIILREPGSGTRKETEQFFAAHGIDMGRLNVSAQMEETDSIKNAVSQGLGVSVLSLLAARDFADFGRILVFKPEGGPITRDLYLVSHKNRPFSPVAEAFYQFTTRYYQKNHTGDIS